MMPFQSKSQMRACFAADDPNWDCKEWAHATPSYEKLPEKKKKAKKAKSKASEHIKAAALPAAASRIQATVQPNLGNCAAVASTKLAALMGVAGPPAVSGAPSAPSAPQTYSLGKMGNLGKPPILMSPVPTPPLAGVDYSQNRQFGQAGQAGVDQNELAVLQQQAADFVHPKKGVPHGIQLDAVQQPQGQQTAALGPPIDHGVFGNGPGVNTFGHRAGDGAVKMGSGATWDAFTNTQIGAHGPSGQNGHSDKQAGASSFRKMEATELLKAAAKLGPLQAGYVTGLQSLDAQTEAARQAIRSDQGGYWGRIAQINEPLLRGGRRHAANQALNPWTRLVSDLTPIDLMQILTDTASMAGGSEPKREEVRKLYDESGIDKYREPAKPVDKPYASDNYRTFMAGNLAGADYAQAMNRHFRKERPFQYWLNPWAHAGPTHEIGARLLRRTAAAEAYPETAKGRILHNALDIPTLGGLGYIMGNKERQERLRELATRMKLYGAGEGKPIEKGEYAAAKANGENGEKAAELLKVAGEGLNCKNRAELFHFQLAKSLGQPEAMQAAAARMEAAELLKHANRLNNEATDVGLDSANMGGLDANPMAASNTTTTTKPLTPAPKGLKGLKPLGSGPAAAAKPAKLIPSAPKPAKAAVAAKPARPAKPPKALLPKTSDLPAMTKQQSAQLLACAAHYDVKH